MRYFDLLPQTEASKRHLPGGFRRIPRKACPRLIVTAFVILIFMSDLPAAWANMQWQSFQIRAELAPYSGVSAADKRAGVVPCQASKMPDENDVGADDLQTSLRESPEACNRHLSPFPGQIRAVYFRRPGAFFALPQIGMHGDAFLLSDLFRDALGQEDRLYRLADEVPGAVTENGSAFYFRLSFFNRDMQSPERPVTERDTGALSTWEMLLQPSGMRGRPLPETIGRIFEPRIDLGIAF
jgi:hypothetical protein